MTPTPPPDTTRREELELRKDALERELSFINAELASMDRQQIAVYKKILYGEKE